MSLVVDDTPITPGGDILEQAAIDELMDAEAAQQLQEIIAQLQSQIDALDYSSTEQGRQITRLTAAINGLDCPKGVQDPNTKEEEPASVQTCIAQGTCTCDTGLALQMPFAGEESEPWPDDSLNPNPA